MVRGWSEDETTFAEVKQEIRRFIAERRWHGHQSPKNLAMSIGIEAAELMEIVQWVDSQAARDYCLESEERFRHVQQEVADVIIYCLSLADTLGFDIAAAIDEKIAHNARRYPAPVNLESKEG